MMDYGNYSRKILLLKIEHEGLSPEGALYHERGIACRQGPGIFAGKSTGV